MGKHKLKSTPKRNRPRKPWYPGLQDKRGRSFNRQMQYCICRLYHIFQMEKINGGPLVSIDAVRRRTADTLDISESVVTKYVNQAYETGAHETPGKSRPRKATKRDISDDVKNQIRELIYGVAEKRQSVTLKGLLALIRQMKIDFHGGRSTLRDVLKDLGFEHRRRDGTQFLIEQPYYKNRRVQFLKKIMSYLNEGRTIVYQDETWTFQRGTDKRRDWQDHNVRSCSKRVGSTGYRFLACHAGSRNGFVPNASLFYRTSKKPKRYDDYHGDMNSEIFMRWVRKDLVPNLHEPSVIVIDNASYHTEQVEKQPTTAWTKNDLQRWLIENNIMFSPTMKKQELFNLCKAEAKKKPKRYIFDEYIRLTTNHVVLRLPPYHSFYNPIELIWGIVKRRYDSEIGPEHDYAMETCERVWQNSLDSVTPATWANCCQKTEDRIREDYDREVVEESFVGIHIIDPVENNDDDDDDDDNEYTVNLEEEMKLLHLVEPLNTQHTFVPDFPQRNLLKQFAIGGLAAEIGDDNAKSPPQKKFKPSPSQFSKQSNVDEQTEKDDVPFPTSDNPSFPASGIINDDETASATANIPGFRDEDYDDVDFEPMTENESSLPKQGDLPKHSPVNKKEWLAAPEKSRLINPIMNLIVTNVKTLEGDAWLDDCDSSESSRYDEEKKWLYLWKIIQWQKAETLCHSVENIVGTCSDPQIIDFYLKLIEQKDPKNLHAYLVGFYLIYKAKGYQAVKEWTDHVDLFEKELLFIPIHEGGNHWCLCVVNFSEHCISYYDSLLHENAVTLKLILEYIKSDYENRKRERFPVNKWTTIHVTDIPTQRNTFDCGVFMCTYAKCLAEHSPFVFTQRDMPQIRQRMIEEIFSMCTEILPPADFKQSPKEPSKSFPRSSAAPVKPVTPPSNVRDFSAKNIPLSVQEWLQKSDDTLIPNPIEPLYVGDLRTLSGNNWLDDRVINLYFSLIVRRSPRTLYALPTQFYLKLCQYSYEKIERWTKVDIFSEEMEMLFIPIHGKGHWTLCVVNFLKRSISYYDSLGGRNEQCLDTIFNYLRCEKEVKKKEKLLAAQWKAIHVEDIPRQLNENDCGVFICMYAEYLSRHAPFTFSQLDMQLFRKRMQEEILRLQLQPPITPLNPKKVPKTKQSKTGEKLTKFDGVCFVQAASFHQGHGKSDAGPITHLRSTAISVIYIVACVKMTGGITREFLDKILCEGDMYFSTCNSQMEMKQECLTVNLITKFYFNGQFIDIAIDHCGQCLLDDQSGLRKLQNAIERNMRAYECESHSGGFLFTANGKTVGITVAKSGEERFNYFMFNSHSVDENNCFAGKRGKARLFRCVSADALAHLLLGNVYCERGKVWELHHITVL